MDTSDNSSQPLLDPEQIKMFLESGADESIDLFNEILCLFEEESQAKFQDMRESRESGDFERFSRAVHALAGSSANIGGKAVWLRARDMENMCKSGNGLQAVAMLDDLEGLYKETLIQMRSYIDQI